MACRASRHRRRAAVADARPGEGPVCRRPARAVQIDAILSEIDGSLAQRSRLISVDALSHLRRSTSRLLAFIYKRRRAKGPQYIMDPVGTVFCAEKTALLYVSDSCDVQP